MDPTSDIDDLRQTIRVAAQAREKGTHEDLERRWFPICARHDLPARHVFEAQLLGRELAVWQGHGGRVNVWENRCPHRGMRLTVGVNLGGELRCAYHGYRFADGTGLCRRVPAQPNSTPPRSLCTKVYPMLERCGLIWTRLHDDPAAAPPPSIEGASTALYSVAVRAPAAAVGALLAGYRFRPSATLLEAQAAAERCETFDIDAYSFKAVASNNHETAEVRLFMQPVEPQCTVVHGVLLGDLAEARRLPTLKHHAQQLSRLRDAVERPLRAATGADGRGGQWR
jgi:nitrite reductase/ring-hydroxylating ferredoxin subunit